VPLEPTGTAAELLDMRICVHIYTAIVLLWTTNLCRYDQFRALIKPYLQLLIQTAYDYTPYSKSKRVYEIRRKVCNRQKEAFPTP